MLIVPDFFRQSTTHRNGTGTKTDQPFKRAVEGSAQGGHAGDHYAGRVLGRRDLPPARGGSAQQVRDSGSCWRRSRPATEWKGPGQAAGRASRRRFRTPFWSGYQPPSPPRASWPWCVRRFGGWTTCSGTCRWWWRSTACKIRAMQGRSSGPPRPSVRAGSSLKGSANPYSPKAIRASAGSVFRVPPSRPGRDHSRGP